MSDTAGIGKIDAPPMTMVTGRAPALLVALLVLANCGGGGGISVGTGLDNVDHDDELLLGLVDQAAQVMVGDDPLAEIAAAEPAPLSASPALPTASGLAKKAPPESARTLDRRITARYSGGRVAALRQRETSARGPVAASDLRIVLHYGSSPASPMDLDETPPPAEGGPEAYVTAQVVGDWVLRRLDGQEQEGGAAWGVVTAYSGFATRYSDWAWALTAPADSVSPFAVQQRWGRWGVDGPGEGAAGRRVLGTDGRIDEVTTRVSRHASGLLIDYRRGFPDGTTAAGVGRITAVGRCPAFARADVRWTVVPAGSDRPRRTVSLRADGLGGSTRVETIAWVDQAPLRRRSTRVLLGGDPCVRNDAVSWLHSFETAEGVERRMTETTSGGLREFSGEAQDDAGLLLHWRAVVRPEGVEITASAEREGRLRELHLRLGPTGAGEGEFRKGEAATAVRRRADGGIDPRDE